MLGCVAAVIAIVSPSQPKPAVIHRTSSSVTALLIAVNAIRCSVGAIIVHSGPEEKEGLGPEVEVWILKSL